MKVEPLKKRRRRWGKGIALVVVAAAALAAYGRLFFSAGVEVGGSFLERQPGADDPNQAVYREFPTGVSATVTGEKTDRARIVFELPGGESAAYAIETAREGDSISASILGEDGGELCRGVLAGNGEWTPHVQAETSAVCAQRPEELVTMAAGDLRIRGRWGYFLAGLLLFTAFGLDIRFLGIYHLLANGVDWKRPKPLEFCMVLQSIFHIFMVLMGIFMLALAVAY